MLHGTCNLKHNSVMAFEEERKNMVEKQLKARGISDEKVLSAFLKVPRHKFLAKEVQNDAYSDRALPIEFGQTISQPYIVALMTQALELNSTQKVLEIGAGSGYQTMILSELAGEIFAIERIPELKEQLECRIKELGCSNVTVMEADGSLGFSKEAPFDAILVGAASPEIPDPLIQQLKDKGKLVIPVGHKSHQVLVKHKELTPSVYSRLMCNWYCRQDLSQPQGILPRHPNQHHQEILQQVFRYQ